MTSQVLDVVMQAQSILFIEYLDSLITMLKRSILGEFLFLGCFCCYFGFLFFVSFTIFFFIVSCAYFCLHCTTLD